MNRGIETARSSRKEWARQRRTPYVDLMPEASTAIADYATPEEIAALQAAMRERRKEAGPLLPSVEAPFAAPHPLNSAAGREESDDYGGAVAILNPKLRVIRGKCGLQWIAQHQGGRRNGEPLWKSFAYCATKEGLLLRLPKGGDGCDPEAWAAIEALPEYFPKRQGCNTH